MCQDEPVGTVLSYECKITNIKTLFIYRDIIHSNNEVNNMRKGMIIILLVGLLAASVFSTGCLEDAKKAIKGDIVIKGKVETVSEPPAYTYNFIMLPVVNGPAKVKEFEFDLDDANGDTVVKGKVGYFDIDDGSIQFINNAGEEDTAEERDVFSIIVYKDCTGGKLDVEYDGEDVDEYDLV